LLSTWSRQAAEIYLFSFETMRVLVVSVGRQYSKNRNIYFILFFHFFGPK
jgi:hypothetical protein